jgi:hypothetical protein
MDISFISASSSLSTAFICDILCKSSSVGKRTTPQKRIMEKTVGAETRPQTIILFYCMRSVVCPMLRLGYPEHSAVVLNGHITAAVQCLSIQIKSETHSSLLKTGALSTTSFSSVIVSSSAAAFIASSKVT